MVEARHTGGLTIPCVHSSRRPAVTICVAGRLGVFSVMRSPLRAGRFAAKPLASYIAGMDPKHLGKPSAPPASPQEAALDYVPNPRRSTLYCVRFAAPEFTSLCPVTGQPDFAHLVIDYVP